MVSNRNLCSVKALPFKNSTQHFALNITLGLATVGEVFNKCCEPWVSRAITVTHSLD